MKRARWRTLLLWVALMGTAVWCVAIGATAIRVQQVRSDLARLASDVAHHNAAHHPPGRAASTEYLDLSLRVGVGREVRSASLRVVRDRSVRVVEVRVDAVVGFALGGHPTIAITVVRSAPVE